MKDYKYVREVQMEVMKKLFKEGNKEICYEEGKGLDCFVTLGNAMAYRIPKSLMFLDKEKLKSMREDEYLEKLLKMDIDDVPLNPIGEINYKTLNKERIAYILKPSVNIKDFDIYLNPKYFKFATKFGNVSFYGSSKISPVKVVDKETNIVIGVIMPINHK